MMSTRMLKMVKLLEQPIIVTLLSVIKHKKHHSVLRTRILTIGSLIARNLRVKEKERSTGKSSRPIAQTLPHSTL